MIAKDVERKLSVFISSKIDARYNPIRRALKTLLIETGLVASVYQFEQEASSQNTQVAYLSEVSQSDLCIFLIDNADGVSDPVYEEHKRAINTVKHRLYFFCDEYKKEEVPLTSELRQSGVTIYRPIHEFAEIPKIAYERTIQDILDWYRNNGNNLASDKDITSGIQLTAEAQTFQIDSSIKLDKSLFYQYSASNILVRKLNPYGEKIFPQEQDTSSSYDNLCADFLSMVIGHKNYDAKVFSQLTDGILSEPLAVDGIADILRVRFNAIDEFYTGNIDNCIILISKAYELALSSKCVPEWMVSDIAIDMRNIDNGIDDTKNILHYNSKGQEIIDKSSETLYYPLLDRFAGNHKSKLLKEHFEMLTESPYTNRVGIMNGAFDDIASCFNIAVRFGSLTHIRMLCNRYAEILFTKYVDCKDVRLFRELARIYILEHDEKSLGKVVKSYSNSVDAVTTDDIEVIIESIATVPLKHSRFKSICLLLEYFGYYMTDEQYTNNEDIFFAQSIAWCEDENERIVSVGHFILRTAFSIIGRSDNQNILELTLTFFSKGLSLFYDEALKILENVEYTQYTEEIQLRVMRQLVIFLAMENMTNNDRCHNAIIAFRKTSTIDTSELDTTVKKENPNFFNGVYDLEIGLLEPPQAHLDKYIKEAQQRIAPTLSKGFYISHSYNPCDIIRNILIYEHISLKTNQISRMIKLIQETIINENNQGDAKESALSLAIYLRNTYPSRRVWKQFSDLIESHEKEIMNARFESLFGKSDQNTLRCCYLLLKISLRCTSFEDVAIGFATMNSYAEREYIKVLRYVSEYLSDADMNEVDNGILGIILNFVLSVGEDKHSDALRFAVAALIELLRAKSYAPAALIRLTNLMINANSYMKILILRNVSKTDCIKTDLGHQILQNGRTSTLLTLKLWIKTFKLDSGIRGCKLPIHTFLQIVASYFPIS